mmetsp:Transcript_11857/g.26990  ORF Transcript_11857/g.26990 Transcript_11857/m.26990 type:complete len:830 (+) Transcript_11857:103-2592(+)
MSNEPDYYEVIGVPKEASLQDIRTKFRSKVLAEHPDKGGDPKKFQLLNKAYNVLTDQDKRRRYDATGSSDKSPEDEFMEGFGGGRMQFEARPKAADAKALVTLQDRIITGPMTHEEGFSEWLRQRDQSSMVLTDKDFMKSHLFNASELSTKLAHTIPVQHVLGSPKTDAYGKPLGGPVAVKVKSKKLGPKLLHDELLLRMMATPIDESTVFVDLHGKADVCLGHTGVARVEQVGSRVDEFRRSDPVIVMPKPGRYKQPIGTARTLMVCKEEDVIRMPAELFEDFTPEQICLMPAIVSGYVILELFSSRLKPGDSILLNAAHAGMAGSALVQLCKLLRFKVLCILSLPGAPKATVQGEYGQRDAWQDSDQRGGLAPTLKQHYEQISEHLIQLGVEEVFPDAVSLLRWRERNQRLLPKVALDGLCTKDSTEQLLHCLHKEGELVVYGNGGGQRFQLQPSLLSSWGGEIHGFSVARWLHQSSGNVKKMVSMIENFSKLLRKNKFTIDTVMYKVGEDSVADACNRAGDPTSLEQVVLIYPTIKEEEKHAEEDRKKEEAKQTVLREEAKKKEEEDREREQLKHEWLSLLFTEQSVASMSSDGPLPVAHESKAKDRPTHLIVWLGDDPNVEWQCMRESTSLSRGNSFVGLSWPAYTSSEGFSQLDLSRPEVLNASWYLRKPEGFENADLDSLHDVEVLARALVECVEPMIAEHGLKWSEVILAGFGKGAGVLLYAMMTGIVKAPVAGVILFQPIVVFPTFMESKAKRLGSKVKVYIIWGSRDKYTPAPYRQSLQQIVRKQPDVTLTVDNTPDPEHIFNQKSVDTFDAIMSLLLKR